MKVALVGSCGYIASYILNKFSKEKVIDSVLKLDVTNNSDSYLNLAEADKFDYTVMNDIDYVVFTAAISSPDRCAKDYELCWHINVIGTCYFIKEAIKRNCKVLFFSSDAVFGDIPGVIYDEESNTQAVTAYGKMKKKVEDTFKGENNFKSIRLSYVASSRDRFYTYCIDCVKKGLTANIFHPFYRNVIVVSDVVDVVYYFASHWEEYKPTFLNVAGKELVSRVRMADELNRFIGGKLKYTVCLQGDDFFVNRHRITQMRSLYMQKYKILSDKSYTEKIIKELEKIIL